MTTCDVKCPLILPYVSRKLEELTVEQLDETLKKFYAEVRNKNGEEYSKNTLLGLRSGLERFLNGPPHNRGIQISKNPAFKNSNLMLVAKLKNLKQVGQHSVQHKSAIEPEDLRTFMQPIYPS